MPVSPPRRHLAQQEYSELLIRDGVLIGCCFQIRQQMISGSAWSFLFAVPTASPHTMIRTLFPCYIRHRKRPDVFRGVTKRGSFDEERGLICRDSPKYIIVTRRGFVPHDLPNRPLVGGDSPGRVNPATDALAMLATNRPVAGDR